MLSRFGLNHLAGGLDGAQLQQVGGAGQSNFAITADAVLVQETGDAMNVDREGSITLHLDHFVRQQNYNGAPGKTSLRRLTHQIKAVTSVGNIKFVRLRKASGARASAILRGRRICCELGVAAGVGREITQLLGL